MSTQPAIYFVKVGFGPRIGCAWLERNAEATDRATLIRDIIDTQITDVMQILCVEDGLATDVTEEIAMAVADWSAQKCEPLHQKVIDWVHDFGSAAVARELRAA